ncbi:MAG: hypothetical protein WCA56_00205 [Xanthobacteraceae bacterium]
MDGARFHPDGFDRGGRLEAALAMLQDEQHIDLLWTLAAMIVRSQIVVARPLVRRSLPAGFDEVDVAILDWIAAEGRRAGRSLVRI